MYGPLVIYVTGTLVTLVIDDLYVDLLTIQIKLIGDDLFHSRRNQR